MTQESGPSQPGYPRPTAGDGSSVAGPGPAAPGAYGSNPYSAGSPPGDSGSWGRPGPAARRRSAVNAASIVQLAAGIAVLVSLLLVWADYSCCFLDRSTPASSTFVGLATNSDGSSQGTWLDLVLLGVAIALVAAMGNLSMRDISRAASAGALAGFGLILVGAGYFLSAGMTGDYSLRTSGPGVYLCLVAAGVGALTAMALLANPRLGTTRIAAGPTSAGPTGYWAAPPPWGGAVPHQPDRAWPPEPLAPTYPAPAYAVPAYAPTPFWAPAQIVVLEAGQSRMRSVRPGEQLLVGSDPEAQVRLADPAVQPRHALIERRGNSWVVRDLQTASPSRLMDASGRIGPVAAETTIDAGQLLIGSVLVTLYPGQR